MLAVNFLVILYVIVTTIILLIANPKQKKWKLFYLVLNCFIVLWEMFPFLTQIDSGVLKVVFDWSPLLLLPILHRETEILTSAFNKAHYDNQFIRFENKYFPSVMRFHYNNR